MDKYEKYDALTEVAMALDFRIMELSKRSETDEFWAKSAKEARNALNIIRKMAAEAGEEIWPTN
ncbi:hypothetical protein [Endozoicomonas acroporae]|uniref:hypothetical protein n=1 Tax=Endozoicomonas acroporae TaxID=1701104 RepID=UPI0013D47ABD|nr:hypothetical protein [Endozoicomonas acroporae]